MLSSFELKCLNISSTFSLGIGYGRPRQENKAFNRFSKAFIFKELLLKNDNKFSNNLMIYKFYDSILQKVYLDVSNCLKTSSAASGALKTSSFLYFRKKSGTGDRLILNK